MENYYKTLNIPPSAQNQEIKKAYFELAKKYHPDSGDEAEVKRFYLITEAYKTLSDKELRKVYDQTLNAGLEIIKTAEQEIISKNPVDPVIYAQKRDPYRDEELKEFHHNRFKKAIFRVLAVTLFHGVLGTLITIVLKGNFILGALAGIMIGFSHSIRQNFDIQTFFETDQKKKLFHIFVWFILILGALYFVALILFTIF